MPATTKNRADNRKTGAGGLRVLVISNVSEKNKSLQAAFKKAGIVSKSVRTLQAALTIILETEYHLIVLDLDLPSMSGAEALRRLRSTGNRIPVIVMTRDQSIQTAMDCGRLEVLEYLQKPVKTSDVLSAVQSFGERMGKIQNILVAIGKNVRRMRTEAGLTLKVLAEKADTSISLISHVELARASASIGTLLRIANALGVDIKTLFEEPRAY